MNKVSLVWTRICRGQDRYFFNFCCGEPHEQSKLSRQLLYQHHHVYDAIYSAVDKQDKQSPSDQRAFPRLSCRFHYAVTRLGLNIPTRLTRHGFVEVCLTLLVPYELTDSGHDKGPGDHSQKKVNVLQEKNGCGNPQQEDNNLNNRCQIDQLLELLT